MPGKPYHQVLIYRDAVLLSTEFDVARNCKRWKLYSRPQDWRTRAGGLQDWWKGLTSSRRISGELNDADLPPPILRAWAYTEWMPYPNGTSLWVEANGLDRNTGVNLFRPNNYYIWYSPRSWDQVLLTPEQDWEYMGTAVWPLV